MDIEDCSLFDFQGRFWLVCWYQESKESRRCLWAMLTVWCGDSRKEASSPQSWGSAAPATGVSPSIRRDPAPPFSVLAGRSWRVGRVSSLGRADGKPLAHLSLGKLLSPPPTWALAGPEPVSPSLPYGCSPRGRPPHQIQDVLCSGAARAPGEH